MDAAIEALKKRMALAAVQRHRDLGKAARQLGLTPQGLRTLLRRYGIRCFVKVTKTLEVHLPKQ